MTCDATLIIGSTAAAKSAAAAATKAVHAAYVAPPRIMINE
jgi:hypothetical protein